jgi:hypothetical protein
VTIALALSWFGLRLGVGVEKTRLQNMPIGILSWMWYDDLGI